MFDNKKIILASKSPRRQMLLTEAGIDFTVKPVDILEDDHERALGRQRRHELLYDLEDTIRKAQPRLLSTGPRAEEDL